MEILLNGFEAMYLVVRDLAMRMSPLKYYQNDPPDYRPEKFSSVLKKTKLSIVKKKRMIFLLRPFDPVKPSITFHHGAGQINHMLPATFILGKDILDRCNVFVIKAQKHMSTYEYLSQGVDSFFHQQQVFAGSVLAVEEIVKYHKKHSKKPIVVSGASMGGIVATLHAIFFSTGDFYVPLTAYPNVGEIFLGPSYRSGVAGWHEKRQTPEYINSYRIEKSFPPGLAKRIFPVLGTYDRVVPFAKAEDFWKKQGITPKIFPYGHFVSIIKCKEIQKIILKLGGT